MLRQLAVITVLLLALIVAWATAAEEPAAPPPYLAVFTDGSRVEGQQVVDWSSHTSSPRLDDTSLVDPARPLRWLRDRRLSQPDAQAFATGFIEFVGGDRLPGRVVGFEAGDDADADDDGDAADDAEPDDDAEAGVTAAHLVVVPLVPTDHPSAAERKPVRVLPEFVRRIVGGRVPTRRLPPGTLVDRDGRRVSFHRARWSKQSLDVLLDDGVRQVPLVELAEVRFPRHDPWEGYYDQLARVGWDGSLRLLRLESSQGLIVSAGEDGLRGAKVGSGDSERWYHGLQPAWSLDMIWVSFDRIRTRLSFTADEVPLSRIEPMAVERRPILSHGWPWQVDRSVQGGPLVSGGKLFGWGIGVHAPCALSFEIPLLGRGFRSYVGLDVVAGQGGCARAAVRVNSARGTSLYQSPHLVGSDQVVDTGVLKLAGPSKGQHRLVLVADGAVTDHPAGADPLDIRDTLDWLEPMILLDPAGLKAEVDRRRAAREATTGQDVQGSSGIEN